MSLLASYDSMKDLTQFFLYLFEELADERLFEIWLAKDMEMDFDEFKKKVTKKGSTSSRLKISKEIEERNIAYAENVLRIRNVSNKSLEKEV